MYVICFSGRRVDSGGRSMSQLSLLLMNRPLLMHLMPKIRDAISSEVRLEWCTMYRMDCACSSAIPEQTSGFRFTIKQTFAITALITETDLRTRLPSANAAVTAGQKMRLLVVEDDFTGKIWFPKETAKWVRVGKYLTDVIYAKYGIQHGNTGCLWGSWKGRNIKSRIRLSCFQNQITFFRSSPPLNALCMNLMNIWVIRESSAGVTSPDPRPGWFSGSGNWMHVPFVRPPSQFDPLIHTIHRKLNNKAKIVVWSMACWHMSQDQNIKRNTKALAKVIVLI